MKWIIVIVALIWFSIGKAQKPMALMPDATTRINCGCKVDTNKAPLYVIKKNKRDKNPFIGTYKQSNLDSLETKNIARIEILNNKKDVNRFGEKGKNGVIIITLKWGIVNLKKLL